MRERHFEETDQFKYSDTKITDSTNLRVYLLNGIHGGNDNNSL